MSNAVKILPHYTYADYEQWEGQWELIDGIPYAMSPSPVPRHQFIAAKLLSEFVVQLKNCNKCAVYQPIDYRVADDTILQPDMLVVCGEITKRYLDFAPALVVEILSPATALKDRHTKFSIYETKGINYYIIISPDNEEVEIFELNNGAYRLTQHGHSFTHEFKIEGCMASIDFNEVW